jgi:hypothetical protein
MAGVKITITAVTTQVTKALQNLWKRFAAFHKKLGGMMLNAGRYVGGQLINGMKWAVVGGVAAVAGLIYKSIQKAGQFEQLEVQFEVLMKSAAKAKERMDELKTLALDVPVTFVDMAEASRMLEVFTEGAFASTDAMRMMSDAAAASGRNIQEVAFWYGRAYSMVKSGRPFGEAAMRLQEMGLLTGTARNQMERLGRGSRNTAKVMAILNSQFTKFSGASSRAALTWGGQISMWQDAWDQALDAVGKELLPFAKTKLTAVTEAVKRMIKDGTLTQWGKNIVATFEKVEAAIRANVGPALKFLQDKLSELSAGYKQNGISGIGEVIAKDVAYVLSDIAIRIGPSAHMLGIEIGGGLAKGIAIGISQGVQKNLSKEGLTNALKDFVMNPLPGQKQAKEYLTQSLFGKGKSESKKLQEGISKLSTPKTPNLSQYQQMSQSGQLQSMLSGKPGQVSTVRIESVSEDAAKAIHKTDQSTGGF